ncbi:TonB-dependent receptor [Siphonobacter sp. BAB-5405]|uniref:TonB-dependent receptor domain-containing protein n=1 Tax=Siphonobacter sp. BAB-5405 TaxID=1864825 RepID=UPI000C7FFA71|nr:outer membrane beta-barrel family protein [Siphonobacter sp. BAB-5405]PMD98115.1 TonB-dependent receptor [Siphonobacter sp. BAB-5405]
MKRYVFTLSFGALFGLSHGYAQVPIDSLSVQPVAADSTQPAAPKNPVVTGFLVDSTGGKPVEFASVALFNRSTNQLVTGTVADGKGQFTISNVTPGNYRLQISFVGYETKSIEPLNVIQDVTLGVIKLTGDSKTLQEVTVTGQKALIEEKVDRLVYNAEKDISSKGGDASDILRKVPMLSVDLDGNVSMRGSSNIRVLINNKPSTIVASSVADALKQIPADQIATVEVITSPSAKYDAEGSGGIINIITKKNNLQGFNLNLDTGVGNRGANLGLNGNYRQGKMGFTLGGFGRAEYNVKTLSTLDQTSQVGGNTLLSRQTGEGMTRGLMGRYNLGWDYDISKNQSITAGIRYGLRNRNVDQDYLTELFTNGTMTGTQNRNVTTKNNSGTIDANIDYLHIFKPQQEWSVSALYSRNDMVNNFDADLLSGESLTGRQRNLNDNVNQEFTLQTDYQTPIQKNQMLEFGLKGIMRKVNSDYEYLLAGPTGNYFPQENNPKGFLDYNQNIAAGYASYTYTTKNKYTFKVGTRYEYTAIDARSNTDASIAIPNYSNFVPSLNISKALKTGMVKLAYNRRIQRPGIQQLNPNFNAANPQNVTMGNPLLRPELTDNVELGYSNTFNKAFFNAAVFGRFTNNSITQVRTPLDTLAGAILTTFENIGSEHALGVNLFFKYDLSSKFSLDFFTNSYYTKLQGTTTGLDGLSINIENSGVNVDFGSRIQATLGKGWGIQGFGMMRGPQVQLQGRMAGFGFYNLGIRKDFANKKGSIGIAAENFLSSNIRMKTELTSPQFTQVNNMYMYNRGVRLTFSYKIGKMSMQAPRRRAKSIQNDDVKDGGGNDTGAGMQNGSGGQSSGGSTPSGGAPAGGGKPTTSPKK